eukprot:TRINITY_DN907_c1_g1_i1.p1 TRINITY_DN907_c1_g1~~TRINITY_DN907_c1_g1_i1.p1  ORF type:complete len:1652 (-),score=540.96 TRINITY_DN907_c1_g1_i1:109-5064(-)
MAPQLRGGSAAPAGSLSVSSRGTAAFGARGAATAEEHAASLEVPLKVVCRIRPLNDQERRAGGVGGSGGTPAVAISEERSEVAVLRGTCSSSGKASRSVFHVDRVLTPASSQEDVFRATLSPLVMEVLAGYEAAAIACGGVGSGKTYTIEGEDAEVGNRVGLVQRLLNELMQSAANGPYVSWQIALSCLEICNEEMTDLLASPTAGQQQQRLEIHETADGITCEGLCEVPVASPAEALALLRRARERRRGLEARQPARSGRCHRVFGIRVCVRTKCRGGEIGSLGKLHLVDLATPPPSASSGEGAFKAADASFANLNRVLGALREGRGRVPYRNSVLTRLLQDALGGCIPAVLIANASPALCATDDTVATLSYLKQVGLPSAPAPAAARASSQGPVAVTTAASPSRHAMAQPQRHMSPAPRSMSPIQGASRFHSLPPHSRSPQQHHQERLQQLPPQGVAVPAAGRLGSPAPMPQRHPGRSRSPGVPTEHTFGHSRSPPRSLSPVQHFGAAPVAQAPMRGQSQQPRSRSPLPTGDVFEPPGRRPPVQHEPPRALSPQQRPLISRGVSPHPQPVMAPAGFAQAGGAGDPTAGMMHRQLAEAQSQVARFAREAAEMRQRADRAEAKSASMHAQLDEVIMSDEEMRLSLEDARHREVCLEERLRLRAARADAARSQLQKAVGAAEEGLPALAEAATGPSALAAKEASEAVETAVGKMGEAMEALVSDQKRLLSGFSAVVEDASASLRGLTVEASTAVRESAAAEQAATSERLGAISAAAQGLLREAADNQASLSQAADEGRQIVEMQAERLREEIRQASTVHGAELNQLSQGVAKVRSLAASSEDAEKLRDADDASARQPLASLEAQLAEAAAKAEALRDAAENISGRGRSDAGASMGRRARLAEALVSTAEAHAAAVNEEQPALQKALALLGGSLNEGAPAVEGKIATLAAGLETVRVEAAEVARSASGDLERSLASGDALLQAMWKEDSDRLAALALGLKKGDVGKEDGLAEVMLGAVATLDEARQMVAKELETLQEQRAAEQKLVGLLQQQREALSQDLLQTQDALADATKRLAATRSALVAAQQQEAADDEALFEGLMGRLEGVLMQQADALGQSLEAACEGDAAAGLGNASARLQRALQEVGATDAAIAETTAKQTTHAAQLTQLLQACSAAGEKTVGSLLACSERQARAARELSHVAAEPLDDLAGLLMSLQKSQDSASERWAATKTAALAAVGKWASSGQESARELQQVAGLQSAVRAEVASLASGAAAGFEAAEEQTAKAKESAETFQRNLQEVERLHQAHDIDDVAAEERRRELVSQLHETLLRAIAEAGASAKEAAALGESADAYTTLSANNAEALWPALSKAEEGISSLSAEVRNAMDAAADSTAQLRGATTEASHRARQRALESTEAVRLVADSVGKEAEAQRMASAAAVSAEEARWLELERSHGAILRNAEATASQAAAAAESSAAAARNRANEERTKSEAAEKKNRDAVDELVRGTSQALSRQLAHWREGVGAKPFSVFEEDDMKSSRGVEEPSTGDLSATVSSVLSQGLAPRPNEASLLADFRGRKEPATTTTTTGGGVATTSLKASKKFIQDEASLKQQQQQQQLIRDDKRVAMRQLQVAATGSSAAALPERRLSGGLR